MQGVEKQGSSGGAQNISDLFLDENKVKVKDTAKFNIEYGQAILNESIKQMLFK